MSRERAAMGYLSEYEHDIFVSYAHSDLLNDWSKDLIERTRSLVAGGLGLRAAEQVGLWWDYRISGNQPLTNQLREKAERSAILLVLMSEWYLESSWCRDELEWFVNAIEQKRAADRPVFVVRVRATDHGRWPTVFKDERGHPLTGYDFVRDAEDNALGLPKGYPRPEDAPDSKEYYEAVSKLASDIVGQLRTLAQKPRVPEAPPPVPPKERVFLAAAPAEDVDDLRDELAGLLRASGCLVVPETNPLDLDQIHEQAGEWVSGCDKFVQVLGCMSGAWQHDDTGFVMYQYEIAKTNNKPIFVYRAPSLETSWIKKPIYREFLERFDQGDVGELENFAARVVRSSGLSAGDAVQSVFLMASERDQLLEREVRRLLDDLDIAVFPLARPERSGRELASVLDEHSSFLDVVKRCGAILLINGNVKEEDRLWVDGRVADIKYDIQRKLGGRLPYAIVDAPPDPRLEPWGDVRVFSAESPTLKHDLQGWLRTLSSPAGQARGSVA